MIRLFGLAFVVTLGLLYAPLLVAVIAGLLLIRHYPRKA